MRPISLILLLLAASLLPTYAVPADDNEFAEFEDENDQFLEDAPRQDPTASVDQADDVKKTDDFVDDDFGVTDDEQPAADDEDKKDVPPQPLKFADVPSHFRSNWASYQVEGIVVVIIVIYLFNYVLGKTMNQQIATQAFDSCKELLEKQFALVGDDGINEVPENEGLRRETDSSLSIWCSGRINLNYMQIQMKMLKRQDLVSRVMEFIWPINDRLTVKISLDNADADPIILCIGEKKAVNRQVKDMLDLGTFTTEKKSALAQFNIPNSFTVFAEQAEVAYTVLEPAIVTLFRKYEEEIEFLHISDQFVGPKLAEGETFTKMPEVNRVLLASFNLSKLNNSPDALTELFSLILYLVDKLKKVRLSREAKFKADKKRKEFEEAFQKTAHAYRQEIAQARREEKTRERKQKLMEEEDPDKQRRLEAKELKREAKNKQPKMKQMKMK